MKKVAILGGSRGIGAALAKEMVKQAEPISILLVSRKLPALEKLRIELHQLKSPAPEVQILSTDLSKETDQSLCLEKLASFQADHIFCCAGGGPYGAYASKEWKDHLWAYQLCFLFPARLLHWALSQQSKSKNSQQLVLIGSAIAENNLDKNAASYNAAKKAQEALFQSVLVEDHALDLRLFSPGYVDTDLLPPSAEPRYRGNIWPATLVAEKLWAWSRQDTALKHLTLAPFASENGR